MSDVQNQLDEIMQRLERLDEAIRGNGHPGIKTRLDILERGAKVQSRLAWLIIGAGITIAASDIAAIVIR